MSGVVWIQGSDNSEKCYTWQRSATDLKIANAIYHDGLSKIAIYDFIKVPRGVLSKSIGLERDIHRSISFRDLSIIPINNICFGLLFIVHFYHVQKITRPESPVDADDNFININDDRGKSTVQRKN